MAPNAIAGLVNVESLKELMRTLLQTTLIELHTLTPDGDDVWSWLDGLFGLYQGFPVAVERLAKAIGKPDPDRIRRFVQEIDFYRVDEPVIASARAIQRGEVVSSKQVAAAALAEPISHYAQELGRSYRYIRAASDYVTSDMPVEELKKRLDVGALGRDGIAV